MRARVALLTALAACSGCGGAPQPAATADGVLVYPSARRQDIVDTYHGVDVVDPYRWLEEANADDTRAWVDAQRRLAERFLATLPGRESWRARLRELWHHPRWSPPERHGSWWTWTHSDGVRDQPILYRAADPAGPGAVLLDPNALSDDGTVSLAATAFSHDGAHVACALSYAGSDWRQWQVFAVATGARVGEPLLWSKFAGAAWTHDGAGFFYVRYPRPPENAAHVAITEGAQLCYHRIGTAQDDDAIVYERPDRPRWGLAPTVTDDGRYLLIELREGTDRRRRWAWVDLEDQDRGVRMLLSDFDAAYDFIGNQETTFYFRTDADAPRGRVIAIDASEPARERWRTVVASGDATLDEAHLIGGRLVVVLMRDAQHIVRVHALDGTFARELELPGPGSVGQLTGRVHDTVTFFSFTSFTTPPMVLRHDLDAGQTTTLHQPTVAFDPEAFVTRQVFLQSRDGTRLPMFLVHRRDLALDGRNRVFLYGYGGFNISLTPSFSADRIAWLERGGIYAQPALRGGGEYGEEWHAAGMLERKQNVFDDFIAAAEYLIRNGYCRPGTLAIGGGSNGGLLVGACLTQRPDLFGAAVPAVGVLDMLRYQRFTIGWAWVPEYGSSDDPTQFAALHAYSPLHNVKPGTLYPPTLILTGDHDDRVVPAHSFKFAAALQHAQAGAAPILLRVETDAGHGAGTPLAKRIAVATDQWAFLDAMLAARP